ncbi:MAG: glycosyl hydrolase family 28 protein, partial [Saprospiraceae bacterium]
MKAIFLLAALSLFSSLSFPTEKVRIFMIGDSTMANKNPYDAPETGWGQVFNEFFNADAVEIQNHAQNGRSTKSFRDLGHWDIVYKQLKAGDYVFIQFGHNDQKQDDPARYAPAQTDYRNNLIRYIHEVNEKGAFPVLLTPVNRRKYDENGDFVDQHADYPDVVREVAIAMHVPLLDMHKRTEELLKALGEVDSKDLFMNVTPGIYPKFPNGLTDNTHFMPFGAHKMAQLAAAELVKTGHPLRVFLKKSVFNSKMVYELPIVNEPDFRKDTFNIQNYGAKDGGKEMCSLAINQAIQIADSRGGGVVLVPKGFWLSGPIVLKSNVNLHLEEGALIQFSDNRNDYPIIETTWEGQSAYRCQAPVSGLGLSNIAITGKGIMDGAGQVWKMVKKDKLTESQWKSLVASGGILNDKKDSWYPSEQSKYGNENTAWTNKKAENKTLEDYKSVRDFLRPNMISLTNCKNVLLEDMTFLNSPAWTLHPLLCKHVTIRNVNVKNPWYGQNNDAIDIESCTYGIMDGCTFDTGDDAITIKSGRDEQGRQRGIATSDFIIKNTTVYHGHGGFVIGSEMSGGVHDLYVNNCNFLGTDIGLRFKTTRGRGGIVENIYISDINMNNILGDAIRFNMFYEAKDPVPLAGEKRGLPEMESKPVDAGTPIFRNFEMENIFCKGAGTAIMMRGLPEANIENITLKNVNITSNKGALMMEARNIKLENVNIFNSDHNVFQLSNVQSLSVNNMEYTPSK